MTDGVGSIAEVGGVDALLADLAARGIRTNVFDRATAERWLGYLEHFAATVVSQAPPR